MAGFRDLAHKWGNLSQSSDAIGKKGAAVVDLRVAPSLFLQVPLGRRACSTQRRLDIAPSAFCACPIALSARRFGIRPDEFEAAPTNIAGNLALPFCRNTYKNNGSGSDVCPLQMRSGTAQSSTA